MTRWIDVAARAALRPPAGLECEAAGTALLVHDVGGRLHAMAAICPHHAAWLSQGHVAGGAIHCPRHMGAFDLRTGRQVSGPPCPDLRIYPVRVSNGRIEVALGPSLPRPGEIRISPPPV